MKKLEVAVTGDVSVVRSVLRQSYAEREAAVGQARFRREAVVGIILFLVWGAGALYSQYQERLRRTAAYAATQSR